MRLQGTATDVSRKVVGMVNKVADLIAEDMDVGDPPARMRHTRITLDVGRLTARQVARENVSTHIGRLQVDGGFDVPDGTCVVVKVSYNSAFHPFGVDKFVAKLSSDELYFTLVAPSGECLRGKGPVDRIVGSTWRRLFLATYLLWLLSLSCVTACVCHCCPAWQTVLCYMSRIV